jgi:hypothetical protein
MDLTSDLLGNFTLTGDGTLSLDEATQLNGDKGLRYVQSATSTGATITGPSVTLSPKQISQD